MKKSEVMQLLEELGSESICKTYARHGVKGKMFGVKYGDLSKLVKKIGVDQTLAEQLWATNNHDARTVAAMICDPATIKASTIDAWAKTADNGLTIDAVARLISQTNDPKRYLRKWIKSKHEWTAAMGWHLLSVLTSAANCEFGDEELADYVDHIEQHLHSSQNHVRYAMNGALIAIGVKSSHLQKLAIAAANRIGKVEVDHGDTACKTPDAVTYINKTVAHRKSKGTVPIKKTSSPKRKTATKQKTKP